MNTFGNKKAWSGELHGSKKKKKKIPLKFSGEKKTALSKDIICV